MTEDSPQILNPWWSIWWRPRATMRWITQRDPDDMVILLVSFAGFSEILIHASRFSLGLYLPIPVIFAVAIIAGPVLGVTGMIVVSLLLRLTGTWLGGQAGFNHLRAAIAWSLVPVILYSILWIPKLIFLGELVFVSRVVIYGSMPHIMAVTLNVLWLAVVMWSLVIFFQCLSEVQKFPVWRAMVSSALALLIVIIVGGFSAAVIKVLMS